MNKNLAILLGALICLTVTIAGTGLVYATHIVTNTVGVDWTDNIGNFYITVRDTAAVRVFLQPNLVITKDVRNVGTGETSADIISAVRGDTIEFILTISNTGNTYALDVVMIDSIPAGTEYIIGSATETGSLDPIDPPDTITFQHIAGGEFDTNESGPITAIKWEWKWMEDMSLYGKRITKFRVRILE